MYTIPGCIINSLLFESSASLVYRGIREADELPVILKVLKEDYPSRAELVRYRQEYEITKNLSISGVIRAYGQEKYGNTLAIILEDFGGESLKILVRKEKLPLSKILELALQITGTLGEIHKAGVIHKDLNPSNIVYNPQTEQLKIIDFGISSKLAQERPVIKNPETLEGTLAYMSPEQTGRMNRNIDYRTDFYALGVTLYELLCGSLPFPGSDPLELVHCHLALPATPLSQVNEQIPQSLSQVVMKLLAKRAEDRYQSTAGIIHDLEYCRQELKKTRALEETVFTPGSHDYSSRFHLPQKLYGRSKQLETLLTAAERVAAGSGEALFVAGFSGVGKSALIGELYKSFFSLAENETDIESKAAGFGFFISGKFEQYHRDIPFSAVRGAFQDLIRQLLTENEEILGHWKQRILEALGPNSSVLTRWMPDLKFIVGETPPVPKLDATEDRNRFTHVLQNFINVFCLPEHPLTIFLDDLQWADLPSLSLIQSMTLNAAHLLFIGAYRNNEVSQAHALHLTLMEMQKAGVPPTIISLTPLEMQDIQEYIADATLRPMADTQELALLVQNKTGGNPFFMGEFLKTLEREKLLTFSPELKGWDWDLARVQQQAITKNVVELIATQITALPEETRAILMKAACLGNIFNLGTLTLVHEQPVGETAADLWPALELNMILPLQDEYKIAALSQENTKQKIDSTLFVYQFAHDRIQEAAYSLLPTQAKKSLHLKAGRLLSENSAGIGLDKNIFEIVDHLNLGVDLIEDFSERQNLALLNLHAGRRAQSSTAYEPALRYYGLGLDLLDESSLSFRNTRPQNQSLALDLHRASGETAYLLGEYQVMELHLQAAMKLTPELLDAVKLYEIRILAHRAKNQPLDAVRVTLSTLQKLGLRMPKNPSKVHILLSIIWTRFRLLGKSQESLKQMPAMEDPTAISMMELISDAGSSAYLATPNLFPLLIFKGVRLSLSHGIAVNTPPAYVTYGLILCGILGDIQEGDRIGLLALEMIERPGMEKIRPLVKWIYQALISHWKRPLQGTLDPLRNCLQIGLEAGDLETTCYGASNFAVAALICGVELETLKHELVAYERVITGLKHQSALNIVLMMQQAIINLMVPQENTSFLRGDVYHEDKMLPLHEQAQDTMALFHLYVQHLTLAYLFMDYPRALENSEKASEYVVASPGMPAVPLLYFYDSLARLATYANMSKSEQKRTRKRVKSNQKKIREWARHAPMNQLHRYNLVAAEEARVRGNFDLARSLYETAIHQARENNYQNDEALAWELGGRFYLELELMEFAPHYIRNSAYAYSRWGADGKVHLMNQTYPEILSSPANRQNSDSNDPSQTSSTSRSSSGGDSLALATIIKTSRAISGEIVLESLLNRMMALVIENAGAQKGYFLLEKQGSLYLEAQAFMVNTAAVQEESTSPDLPPRPIRDESLLPLSILDYTLRREEVVLLKDAFKEGDFTRSKYVQTNRIASVLCVPVRKQGKVIGLLYLENNLTPEAFTAAHVKLLEILSAQLSVSIENARLYGEMENKVKERTYQLQTALDHVETLKKRQDGDYYLTSLLLEPLCENTSTDERIKSDILIKQYKRFQYDKWSAEIGGDMCACHDLKLRGKVYTLFLNADAMGKSMQGAGGSLVLLAALKALLGKVNTSPALQDQSPESWLTGAYNELKQIFATFKGTMQVSLIMGLADGESRRLYFFNGEHPHPVLYRKGRAEYFGEDFTAFKLGEETVDPPFYIESLDLEPGDIVLLGSDGKDDLKKGMNSDGYRVINDDKNLFLECVREAQGEPKEIMASLLKRGSFIDDFSLLRLRVDIND